MNGRVTHAKRYAITISQEQLDYYGAARKIVHTGPRHGAALAAIMAEQRIASGGAAGHGTLRWRADRIIGDRYETERLNYLKIAYGIRT